MIDVDRLRRYVGDVSGMPELFFEAAATERKLPGVLRRRYRVMWPPYADDPSLAFGYNEAEVPLGAATAEEITRYDSALELSQVLEAEAAKLVWACAHSSVRRSRGPAWSKVARLVKLHPATVKRRFGDAMVELWYALDAAERRAGTLDRVGR